MGCTGATVRAARSTLLLSSLCRSWEFFRPVTGIGSNSSSVPASAVACCGSKSEIRRDESAIGCAQSPALSCHLHSSSHSRNHPSPFSASSYLPSPPYQLHYLASLHLSSLTLSLASSLCCRLCTSRVIHWFEERPAH